MGKRKVIAVENRSVFWRTWMFFAFLVFHFSFHCSHAVAQNQFIDLKQTGYASYYAEKFTGKRTASGEIFHNDSLTCAHRTLPFGTLLKVRNLANEQEVVVKVNDRGPFVRDRIIDLSRKAAQLLGFFKMGMAKVTIEPAILVLAPLEITSTHTIPRVWENNDEQNVLEWPSIGIGPAWPLEP